MPPSTGTHLLPLQTWLPWHPREPRGPHFTLQRGALGDQQVARQGSGCPPSPCHPFHPTYGFAVLARISLGMAERGQVSVHVGRVGEQGTPCTLTHRLAVPARGSVLPWWPWGAGDLLHHRAISVPRVSPGGSRVTWFSFLALRARVAKSSTALGRGGRWGWVAGP